MLKIYVGAYYALDRFLVQYSVLYKTDTITYLTLIKMGFLKNDLENFNCLFLKKV
jgi:hypothetical protein